MFGGEKCGELTDGIDDLIHLHDGFRTGHRDRAASAAGIGFPELHADEFHLFQNPIVAHQAGGCGQDLNVHLFVLGCVDFFGVGRHFLARTAIEDGDLVHAQAERGPGRVDGGVAAADDHHVLAQFGWLAAGHMIEKFDAAQDAFQLFAFKAEFVAGPGADAQKDGVKTFLFQIFEGEVASPAHVPS